MFAQINLCGDELEMYYQVHEALAEKIVPPELIVYLRADTDTLMQRIAQRDRPYERNMERSYIDELNQAYEGFFADHQSRRSPVLAIDTNQLDYVRKLEDLEWVAERIRQTLKLTPYQPELPFLQPDQDAPGLRLLLWGENAMRITRELMLKFARDMIPRQARESRNLLAAYLCGSMLGDDFLLGGAGDIDLVLIHDEPFPVEREVIPVNEEIHLDIAHHYQRDYRDTRHLRVHPWLGPTLNDCKALYDPQHFLDFTQASVRGQFARPDHVSERAKAQAETARQVWQSLVMGSQAGGPAMLSEYLRSVGFAANAIASLSGPPLVERRFLQQFPARAEAIGRPGLYQGLLGLLGAQNLDAQALTDWIPFWQAAYRTLPVTAAPIHLHPARPELLLRNIQTGTRR